MIDILFKQAKQIIKPQLYKTYSYGRSILYFSQSYPLPYLDKLLRFGNLKIEKKLTNKDLLPHIKTLFDNDIENMQKGYYPDTVLNLGSPIKHIKNYKDVVLDSIAVSLRKRDNKHKVFTEDVKTDGLPDYYARNFHNQTNGYLSEESAKLYEHQVEILFRGTADAMRRIMLKPLKEELYYSEGEGLHFTEIGCGTGVSTYQVNSAFPDAKITAIDPSKQYLNYAQQKYPLNNTTWVQGFGENLEHLDDESQDLVYSVFLFHELPKKVRQQVIKESLRVLKPGGLFAFVDSIQKDDTEIFNLAIEEFPQEFHEPFYKNYIETPMSTLLQDVGLEVRQSGVGFLSKFIVAKKPRN